MNVTIGGNEYAITDNSKYYVAQYGESQELHFGLDVKNNKIETLTFSLAQGVIEGIDQNPGIFNVIFKIQHS